MIQTVEARVIEFPTEPRHGSPEDRGGADKWYGRPSQPHYFKGGSYASERVAESAMTPDEIAEYRKGYREGEPKRLI